MSIDCRVLPVGNVMVPMLLVKSLPEAAVPLAVPYCTVTGPLIGFESVTMSVAFREPEFPSVTRIAIGEKATVAGPTTPSSLRIVKRALGASVETTDPVEGF